MDMKCDECRNARHAADESVRILPRASADSVAKTTTTAFPKHTEHQVGDQFFTSVRRTRVTAPKLNEERDVPAHACVGSTRLNKRRRNMVWLHVNTKLQVTRARDETPKDFPHRVKSPFCLSGAHATKNLSCIRHLGPTKVSPPPCISYAKVPN